MLEIVIITIIVIAAFIGIAWYAVQRSKKRNHDFLVDLAQRMEPDLKGGDAFNAIFEQELSHQIDDTDIDASPVVSLSDNAQNIDVPAPVRIDSQQKNKTEGNNLDVTIDDDDLESDVVEADLLEAKQASDQHETEPAPQQQAELVNDWDMVLAFTVMATEGQKLIGLDLKVALESLGFVYGDMEIYHRMALGVHKKPLFSVANILDPGTFNPQDETSMTTPGILIFAKLPGPINGLTLFDDLYETAQTLTEQLGGILCDDKRQPVEQSTLEDMRSRIFSLNLALQAEQHLH